MPLVGAQGCKGAHKGRPYEGCSRVLCPSAYPVAVDHSPLSGRLKGAHKGRPYEGGGKRKTIQQINGA